MRRIGGEIDEAVAVPIRGPVSKTKSDISYFWHRVDLTSENVVIGDRVRAENLAYHIVVAEFRDAVREVVNLGEL